MAKCEVCGEKIPLFGSCSKCAAEQRREEQDAEARRKQQEKIRKEQIKGVTLTSETAIHSGIISRHGFIIVEEVARVDPSIEEMSKQLLPKLQEKAWSLNANAVIAVRVEAVKIMDVGIGMNEVGKFMFVASGTAVTLEV